MASKKDLCRARCAEVLDNAEAFEPRSRARAKYDKYVAGGQPLVPAALGAVAMLDELLQWAAQMPPAASQLIGTSTIYLECKINCWVMTGDDLGLHNSKNWLGHQIQAVSLDVCCSAGRSAAQDP